MSMVWLQSEGPRDKDRSILKQRKEDGIGANVWPNIEVQIMSMIGWQLVNSQIQTKIVNKQGLEGGCVARLWNRYSAGYVDKFSCDCSNAQDLAEFVTHHNQNMSAMQDIAILWLVYRLLEIRALLSKLCLVYRLLEICALPTVLHLWYRLPQICALPRILRILYCVQICVHC